ncbi:hypothetical protein [Burkholderia lata]|uniref:hypothetical protein n=1 Tax=Burkholderia lata (strain ATCC 17760 / DSM 23089 / LMG 22485 / NCIMB 9086 / R18194 / 383) TaxID=482957 RepID=UPI001583DFD1|nr:hypothetical protein [Burkholderia lata]
MTSYTIQFSESGQPVCSSTYSDAPAELANGELTCTAEQYASWQQCSLVNGEIPLTPATPAQLLAEARTAQGAALFAARCSAIIAGLTSTVRARVTAYPSTTFDRSDQCAVATTASGGQLRCEVGAQWALGKHTQSQARVVVACFSTWRNTCQQQLVALIANVNAATTAAAVSSVAWVDPTE